MEKVYLTYNIIMGVLGVLLFYRTIYTIMGFFMKPKTYKTAPQDKKYGLIIAARNEELVIGNLIDSLNKQTYNKDLIKIFVVADNCTDNTKGVSEAHGAIVYERFNTELVSKGYALQHLFKKIDEDYGVMSMDAYIVFDADNLVDSKFVEKMNDAFQCGYDCLTSFRNVKNFDTNIVSSGYGIHWYRSNMTSHIPRSILNISTNISGTGFLFKNDIVENGWNYTEITEDIEFTTINVAKGKKIGFCNEAIIYDEQPIDFKTAYKQRKRWARGILDNFKKSSFECVKSFFKTWKFDCYDIFFESFPYGLLTFIIAMALQIAYIVNGLLGHGYDYHVFLEYILTTLGTLYISSFFIGALAVFKHRKVIKCRPIKLIWYLIMWPWFDAMSLPYNLVVLFKKVKWVPIKHTDSRTIEDINNDSKSE